MLKQLLRTSSYAATIALLTATSPAVAQKAPERVPVSYKTTYVPVGFDSNDNVQFVAAGVFANTCYRPAVSSVKVDQERRIIKVGPAAYKYSGICMQVVLPFDRQIEVGILPAGEYTIVQTPDNAEIGRLRVNEAVADSADDHLYAPISQAFLDEKANTNSKEIVLTGEFANSCQKLTRIKTNVQNNVIVVQPITEMLERNDCKDGSFPFRTNVHIEDAKAGRYLIHVRSLNGKAINSLVEMK